MCLSIKLSKFCLLSISLILILTVIHGELLSVASESCTYRKWERPGGIKFLVIAGVHTYTVGGCGQLSRTVFDQLIALDWILTILNNENEDTNRSFIQGGMIGFDLYDNCDHEDLTTDLLFPGVMTESQSSCSEKPLDQSTYIGTLSLTSSKTTPIISRLTSPLPVFRPLPSYPELHSSDFPNLLQTVASFHREAMTIVKMLQAHKWNVIVVIFGDADEDKESKQDFLNQAMSHYICVKFVGPPTDDSIAKIYYATSEVLYKSIVVVYIGSPNGAVTMLRTEQKRNGRPYGSNITWVFTSTQLESIDVKNAIPKGDIAIGVFYPPITRAGGSSFTNYFTNVLGQNNSVFQSIVHEYKSTYMLREPSSPHHTVDSILVAASVARDILYETCANESISLCSDIKEAIRTQMLPLILKGVDIKMKYDSRFLPDFYHNVNQTAMFNSDGTQYFAELHVYKRERLNLTMLGLLTADDIYLSKTNGNIYPTSACDSTCAGCRDGSDVRYTYLHGEILILGLFSLRTYGGTPFSCAEFRRGANDVITVSAFMESIKMRRNQTGIKYGGIAIDDCYNGLNTSHFLTELFSHKINILDPESQTAINFDNVIAIVGALSSSVSQITADLSTYLGIPMISYGASSPDLDNESRYPYFLRTVPSDTLQSRGMIDVLKQLGVTHAGAIYIDDAYGQNGIKRLLEEAIHRNICIESPFSVSQDMTEDAMKTIIEKLYDQQVTVVLFFGIDTNAHLLLDTMTKYFNNMDPLIFVASEAWGLNQKLVDGNVGKLSKGSIIFNIASRSYNIASYKDYLQRLNSSEVDTNPWILKFFEDYNCCDMLASFAKFYTNGEQSICELFGNNFRRVLSNDTVQALYNDQRGIHTMNAVYAATEGYRQLCQQAECSPGLSRTKPHELFGLMKRVQLNNVALFDQDGNGNIGYTLYNIQMQGTNMGYVQIGSYTNESGLLFDKPPKFYNTFDKEMALSGIDKINCINYEHTCSGVCLFPLTITTTAHLSPEQTTATTEKINSSLLMITILGACLATVVVALLFVVVILIRIQCKQKQLITDTVESIIFATEKRGSHYDEVSSILKNADLVCNKTFEHSSESLTKFHEQSITYADVRPMDDTHHNLSYVRQRWKQELKDESIERFEPLQSDHANKSICSPVVQPTVYCNAVLKPITSTQPISCTKTQQLITTKTNPNALDQTGTTSQEFRSSVSSDDNHYATPSVDYSKKCSNVRRPTASVIHEALDDSGSDHDSCTSLKKNCVTPHPSSTLNCADTNKDAAVQHSDVHLTYLTVKDLVKFNSDEEDEGKSDTESRSIHLETFFNNNEMASRETHLSVSESEHKSKCPSHKVMTAHYQESSNQNLQKMKTMSKSVDDLTYLPIIPQLVFNKEARLTNRHGVSSCIDGESHVRVPNMNIPDVIKHGLYEDDEVLII